MPSSSSYLGLNVSRNVEKHCLLDLAFCFGNPSWKFKNVSQHTSKPFCKKNNDFPGKKITIIPERPLHVQGEDNRVSCIS